MHAKRKRDGTVSLLVILAAQLRVSLASRVPLPPVCPSRTPAPESRMRFVALIGARFGARLRRRAVRTGVYSWKWSRYETKREGIALLAGEKEASNVSWPA